MISGKSYEYNYLLNLIRQNYIFICIVVMLGRGTDKMLKNSKINYELIENYSENIDVNQLYRIIEPSKKLPANEIFPVNDAKKMREAQ